MQAISKEERNKKGKDMVISCPHYLRVKQKTKSTRNLLFHELSTMFIRPFSFFFNTCYFLCDAYLYLHFIHNKNLISNEFRTFHLNHNIYKIKLDKRNA